MQKIKDKIEVLEMGRKFFNALRDWKLSQAVNSGEGLPDYPDFDQKLINALADWIVSNGKIFSNRKFQ